MRVFISIDIPKYIGRRIQKIQNALPEFRGKKTELPNLHLTLKFLGEIDEETLEKIRIQLRKINYDSFITSASTIGVFSKRILRIIWLNLNFCDDLQKQIDGNLKRFFPKEKRFMSHLTIARIKSVKNKKRFISQLKQIKVENIEFKVKSFRLKKSTLTRKGPVYETIERYAL